MKTCKSTSGGINKTFIIKPSEEQCIGVSTNHLFSCSGDTSISLSTGEIVISGDLIPVQDGVGAIGLPNRRFREVNTISGTSTTWVSTVSVTGDLFVEDELTTNDLTITGTAIYDNVATGSYDNELVNWLSLTGYTYITDKYVTGGTYDNNTALITFSGTNNFPPFTVDLSSIDVNDTFSTGGTVIQFVTNNNNEQTLQITGNDGFTPYNITGLTDTFATGFTFTPNTLTISQNNGVDLTVNIDSIDLSSVLSGVTFDISTTGNITSTSFSGDGSNLTGIDNFYVTGGSFSSGTLTLNRNDNNNLLITGFTDDNFYTTGVTLSGTTILFDRNDGGAYSVDISPAIPEFDCNDLSGCTIIQDIQNDIINLELDAVFTVELIDELTVDFYAPDDLKINSISVINGSGTITIEVNDNPYTLGDLVNQGDKITVTTDTQVVINMNVRYE